MAFQKHNYLLSYSLTYLLTYILLLILTFFCIRSRGRSKCCPRIFASNQRVC